MAKPVRLHHIAKALGLDVGCGDNSCMWGPPGGMGTNGGCRCKGRTPRSDSMDIRMELTKLQLVARHLLEFYNVHTLADEPIEQRQCEECGEMTRVTTAGCDHCDFEGK